MNAVANYFESLFSGCGDAWNRFWFTPADPIGLSVLRILSGSLTLWLLGAYSIDLVIWFGQDGLLPIETVRQLTMGDGSKWNGRLSYLMLFDDPSLLYAVHLLGLGVVAAFTVGFATRITSVLTLAIVLSYVHRGPMITGPFEPVLTLLLCYLCFAPSQQYYSVDRWRSQKRSGTELSADGRFRVEPSIAANICQRLIQVHLAAIYVMMGLTKLGGSDVWWDGEAMWWLIAHTESRLVDLTFLHDSIYAINLWTHGVIILELSFGLLIWNRLARPLLLVIAALHWIVLGLVTGLLSFTAIMLVANVSFVRPESMRFLLSRAETSD